MRKNEYKKLHLPKCKRKIGCVNLLFLFLFSSESQKLI